MRDSPSLGPLVDELATTEDIASFDRVFSKIYDLADRERAWIEVSRSAARHKDRVSTDQPNPPQ
jgi:hypothetical protein